MTYTKGLSIALHLRHQSQMVVKIVMPGPSACTATWSFIRAAKRFPSVPTFTPYPSMPYGSWARIMRDSTSRFVLLPFCSFRSS
jgi:hypothetical protein